MDLLLSRVDYYDLEATDELATTWYDSATGWFPAYESAASSPSWLSHPRLQARNRKEKFEELTLMFARRNHRRVLPDGS